jgi:hypothetical protein
VAARLPPVHVAAARPSPGSGGGLRANPVSARPPPVYWAAAQPPSGFGVGPNLGVAFGPTHQSGRHSSRPGYHSPLAQVNSDSADWPIESDFGCGGSGGGLGWVGDDGERDGLQQVGCINLV